jgi:hypothetical protein
VSSNTSPKPSSGAPSRAVVGAAGSEAGRVSNSTSPVLLRATQNANGLFSYPNARSASAGAIASAVGRGT